MHKCQQLEQSTKLKNIKVLPLDFSTKIYLEKLIVKYEKERTDIRVLIVFNHVIIIAWRTSRNKLNVLTLTLKFGFDEIFTNNRVKNLIDKYIGTTNNFYQKMVAIIKGRATSLIELPDTFLKQLTDHLTLKDLLNLSSTCKYLNEFYSESEDIWEKIFDKFLNPICTFRDYEDGIKNGGFKRICRKTCENNSNHPFVRKILGLNSAKIGDPTNFPFLRLTNKNYDNECDEDANSGVVECKGFWDYSFLSTGKENKRNAHESLSSSAIGSNSSLTKRFEKLKIDQDDDENILNLTFTKKQLRFRMEYLRIKTEKFKCEEDSLPGDKTVNYALKYRKDAPQPPSESLSPLSSSSSSSSSSSTSLSYLYSLV